MQIIKLNATASTNDYLKKMIPEGMLDDFSVVLADNQTNGRGQRGASWITEQGKNLTFSVLKKYTPISIDAQFSLNTIVSLSIIKALEGYSVPKLAIKWPNDILSDGYKISGILIENLIKNQRIEYSVIGIGLNVNQVLFEGLSKVSSLKTILQRPVNREALMSKILLNLKHYFERYLINGTKALNPEYESYLFKKDKPSTFRSPKNELFTGIIRGVSVSGKLCVQLENTLEEFDLKELKLMY
tara:strand:+ start:25687 stop:26415 length:729 start_codon:yes stop_codon:yes gene_type:complete